jgi:DNA-binding response OmpR family regulator
VLCIDDDADFANVLKIRLEDHGVAVMRAHTGMEGYRLAFTTPASAILLDFNMPDGQGDYILGRLKDNPVTRDIPVVVITGSRDKMLERRMLAMGATAFFVKPVSFDELRDHLSKYIDILGLSKEALVADIHGKKSRRIRHQISEPY